MVSTIINDIFAASPGAYAVDDLSPLSDEFDSAATDRAAVWAFGVARECGDTGEEPRLGADGVGGAAHYRG